MARKQVFERKKSVKDLVGKLATQSPYDTRNSLKPSKERITFAEKRRQRELLSPQPKEVKQVWESPTSEKLEPLR